MMKSCPKCGIESPDAARFCRGCGSSFEEAVPQTQGATAPGAGETSVPDTAPNSALDVYPLQTLVLGAQPLSSASDMPAGSAVPAPPSVAGFVPVPSIPAPSVPPQPASELGAAPVPPRPAPGVPPIPSPAPRVPPTGPMPVPGGADVKPLLTPEQQEKAKAEARAFGDWFRTFVTRPSKVGGGRAWYGIVVIVLTTFLSALAPILVAGNAASGATAGLPYEVSYWLSDMMEEAGFRVFMGLWVGGTVFLYAALGCLRLARAAMADPLGFGGLHDSVAHRLGPWTVLNLVACLLGLVHLDPLALAVWMLASQTFNVWLLVLVWEGNPRRRLDAHWARFLSMLLMIVLETVVAVVIVLAVALTLGVMFANDLGSLLS